MNTSGLDRIHDRTLCTAKRKNGMPCLNAPIRGATVCRMHGGSAPQVRKAAQVRLLMQSDNLMAALLQIANDKSVPVQHRLVAIRDGLDRANLSGTQSVEVGVTTRTFEDWVGDALIDAGEDEDSNVVDAEVIEDDETDEERWAREDAQSERIAARKRLTAGSTPPAPRNPERDRAEAKAIREHRADEPDDGLSAPDKFGTRQDTRKRKVSPSVSTADPHADRYESRGSRRSMSPKRYEARQNDRD